MGNTASEFWNRDEGKNRKSPPGSVQTSFPSTSQYIYDYIRNVFVNIIDYGRNLLQDVRDEGQNRNRIEFMRDHLSSCPDIPVKYAEENDTATCQMIDMLTSESRLTVADYANKVIKIFHQKTGKMTRKIKFGTAPVCLAQIDGFSKPLYCVGFKGETEIHIMDLVSRPVNVLRTIPVNGYFDSVYFSNSNIYVLLRPDNVSRKMQVINEDGQTVNIIDVGSVLGGEGLKSCFVHDVTETIYVQSSRKIIHLDQMGQILNSFSFGLGLPEGHDFNCWSFCVDLEKNINVVRPKFRGQTMDGYVLYTFTQDLRLSSTLQFRKPGRSFNLMRSQDNIFYFAQPIGDCISVFRKE